MLDGKAEMQKFLKMLASEPAISKVPVMIDSSKWEVIEEGLKKLARQMYRKFNQSKRR